MRRAWIWILLLLVAAALLWINLPETSREPAARPEAARTSAPVESPSATAASPGAARVSDSPSMLAAELNATDGTIEKDLLIVDSVLEAFRTNFVGAGNPVGENNEITAAFTGRNSLGLQLIPRRHPAINPRGELVDRWGTPFFFHQLSGDVMEIRSAGPDRIMHSEDDAVLAP